MMKKACDPLRVILGLVVILFFWDHLFQDYAAAQSNISSIDQNALLALKSHITYDPNNILATNWSTTTSVCSWIGISCNNATPQRVTALNLSSMGLEGSIPQDIGNLSFLAMLDLSNNRLAGEIPSGFRSLPNLEALFLGRNRFSGSIRMSAFNMSSLNILMLSRNRLSGSVPDDICQNLPKIQRLDIGGNQLVGRIPRGLWKCKQLLRLNLQVNKFTGSIPTVLANLTLLEELYLGSNSLTGEIPEELGSLYNLKRLSTRNSTLKGSIPRSLVNCTMLVELSLAESGLTGTIPADTGEFRSLERLYLGGNKLHGNIPISTGNASRLTLLELSRNGFSGSVPNSIGNLRQLQRLNLVNTTLPASIGNLSAVLVQFSMAGCEIKGNIPGEIGNLSSLTKNCQTLGGGGFCGANKDLGGILLMETFTRKKPTDEMFGEGISLKDYVQKALPDSVAKLADEHLLSEEEHLLSKMKCLSSIFTLAMDCVIEFPEQRTDITEVLATLKNIRTRYLADTRQVVQILQKTRFHSSRISHVALGTNPTNQMKNICNHYWGIVGLVLVFFWDHLFQDYAAAQSNISSIDQNALLALKSHITYGPNNFLATNWSTKTSVCSWIGVYYLSNNRFTGEIPSGFGSFANLEVLVLDKNRLSGIIPPSICNISTLRSLSLRENALRGNIPEGIGRLANLETLDLYDNSLSGPIPMSAFNMSSLMTMKLGRNRLNGSLPDDICQNLPNLTWFFIGPNEIVGKIPNGLWKCKKLIQFIVGYNKLTGSIPKVLAILTQLEELQLDSNYLTGTIPAYIGEFSSLERLYLWGNELHGNIPISIGNASRLTLLQLSRKAFSGPVPSSLGNLRQLQRLNLGRNNLTNLSFISSMANCKKLISFQLGFNRFNSILPASIGNLSTSIKDLHLGSCKIKGSIPGEIGNLSSLTKLIMADNELTGPVPTTIGRLKKLQGLSFSNNSGQLPLPIGNLKVIASLELSSNNFSGAIPSTLGSLQNLRYLPLAYNTFQGPIPESFGNLISVETLDLSSNILSGEIPKSFEKLKSLKKLNVSFNALQGEIPDGGPFKNFPVQSFLGNKGLCSRSLPQFPKCKNISPEGEKTSVVHLLKYILPTITSVMLVASFILVWLKCRKPSVRQQIGADDIAFATWKRISYQELLQATDGFCESNLLGVGGFGSVYKGTLPDGTEVAVKRLNIMIDVASGLDYLHYGYSRAIVHCDLKPSNVLLDSRMTAHVSDLGIAKLLGEEDSMAQTKTLATVGYMAPEYGLEGIVSTRGDVYSFGILLMETFTRKKPTDEMFGEGMSLKDYVNKALPDSVATIVDKHLLSKEEHPSAKIKCISSIFTLATDCVVEFPEKRPDMTVVFATLRNIRTRYLANKVRILLPKVINVKQQSGTDDMALATWRRISHQELLQATDAFCESNLLGVGGFGSVYKGTLIS
ncbi:hypothetical protein Tsubulata_030086 [Turnera subulata]|uniref:non-specific serine/threonine protein kinase n=1 Tax=Turnera subulata TaxID=218843 RepID=A0A9Q0FTD1_9ROSI|nr:hypothetical protein Tsubulata_030086 [Turnera subulata]